MAPARREPHLAGPRRLILGIGLGAVLGALLLFVSPERPDKVPTGARQDTTAKIQARLPEMALRVTIPLAAAGGSVMWASRRPTTRRVLPPLAMWAAVAPAGLLAWKLFDVAVPYRIVPFALGVPIAIVLGAAATGRGPTRWRLAPTATDGCGRVRPRARSSCSRPPRGSPSAARDLDGARGGVHPEQYEQAATLAAYLETAPPNTRVVVPMAPGVFRPIRALMITLPVDRYLHVKVWRRNFFGDRALFHERLKQKFPARSWPTSPGTATSFPSVAPGSGPAWISSPGRSRGRHSPRDRPRRARTAS